MTFNTVIAVSRRHTYNITTRLEVHECPSCGVVYGVPEDFIESRRKDAGRFYCPNGHSLSYHESEADKQRKRADALERQVRGEQDTARRWRENAERERRSAIAYKGHLTRIRKRITNGVCPVPGCKRSGFKQVMQHIATQHPDWLHDHPEVAS